MANSEIRIGKVSSVDHEKGMIRVTYRDKDESVTVDFAMLNYNDEYRMPQIGRQVAVAHMSNGSSRGVVLGEVWNKKNLPHEVGKNLYRKDLSGKKDAAYIRYDDESGEYLVKAANLHLNGVNKTVLDGPELELAANISILMQADEVHMDYPELIVTAGESKELHSDVRSDVVVDQEDNKLEATVLKISLEIVEDLKVKAGTEVSVEAGGNMQIASAGELRLKDGAYDTTLTEIMDRLKALEG